MTAIRLSELDADIKQLSADYTKRRGLATYTHAALLDEMHPHKERVPTTYPTPNSHNAGRGRKGARK